MEVEMVRWAYLGPRRERRIHAAAGTRDYMSCRMNPAFLPKRCNLAYRSVKVRPGSFRQSKVAGV
jgi:hypothetical protein